LWTLQPDEILLINANQGNEPNLLDKLLASNKFLNMPIKVLDANNAFPGQSRNLGISHARYNLIAFLDSRTKPSHDWLSNGIDIIISKDISIAWGQTIYLTKTLFEKFILSATYGPSPLRTLPGTILKAEIFKSTGLFIENIRAGEDGDWFSRVDIHSISSEKNNSYIYYKGLVGIRFLKLVSKWFRNYYHSSRLPYQRAQKDLYFYFISVFLILLAFNWNSLSYDPMLDGWNTSLIVYIPNITKYSVLFITSLYFVYRSIYLPIRKGTKKTFIASGSFIPIFFISMILDFVKSAAFLIGRTRPLKKDTVQT